MTRKTLRTLWPTALALSLAACGGGGGGDDDKGSGGGQLPTPTAYTKQWGTASNETIMALKTDGQGNVYVFGMTAGTLSGQSSRGGVDLVLTKYGPDGQRAWERQFGSSGNDEAGGITVDAQGRIIVAATVQGSVEGAPHAGGSDVLVAAFGSDGQRLWTRQWGTSGGDVGKAVAAAQSGEIFVTGQRNGGALLVLKLAADGSTVADLSRAEDTATEGHGIAVSGSSFYVTGKTTHGMDGKSYAGGQGDAFITKRRTSDGTREWTDLIGTAADEGARALAVDASGNVLLTGYTHGALGGGTADSRGDIFVAKYNASGTRQWLQRTGSPAEDAGYAIATDAQGNAYVAGHSAGSFAGTTALGNVDMVLLKYDGGGNPLWVRRLGSALADTAWAVATDAQTRVYLGGQTLGAVDGLVSQGGIDMVLARYDASGNKQ